MLTTTKLSENKVCRFIHEFVGTFIRVSVHVILDHAVNSARVLYLTVLFTSILQTRGQ